jgi:hypothetical protein
MDLREIGWSSVNWIDLAEDRDRWRPLMDVSKSVSQSVFRVMAQCSIVDCYQCFRGTSFMQLLNESDN